MEDVDLFEVVSQVLSFVGAQNTQREADQGPQMNHVVVAAVVFGQLVDLGVAVVTAGDTIGGAGGLDLIVLLLAVGQAFVLESGLEEAAAAATAEVVGFVGLHVDEVFFTYNGFNHKAQVVGNGVAVALPDDLAGVLNREFDLQVFVPVGIDLEFAFTNPFCIVFVDVFNVEVMFKTIFFQSGPD